MELLVSMFIFILGVATIFSLFSLATQGALTSLDRTNAFFSSNMSLQGASALSKHSPGSLLPGTYDVGISDREWVLIPKAGLAAHFILANNTKDHGPHEIETVSQNVPFYEDRKGKPYGAARFFGEGSYVHTRYGMPLQIEGTLTVSAWVSDVGDEASYIAGKYDRVSQEGGYLLYKEGGSFHFKISDPDGSTYTISAPSQGRPWEHVAGVYGNGEMRLYVDGEELSTQETNISSLNRAPGIEFSIGANVHEAEEGKELSDVWHGLISDVRVYNRSLGPTQVKGLANKYSVKEEKDLRIEMAGDPAVAFNLDERGGCVINDNSPDLSHAMIESESCDGMWTENRHKKENSSLSFSGEDYAVVEDDSAIQFNEDFSLSLWVKLPDPLPEEEMTIAHKRATEQDDYSFMLKYNGQGGYVFGISPGTGEMSGVRIDNAAREGEWQHITASFNQTNREMRINNKGYSLYPENIENPGEESHLYLGQNAQGEERFEGSIDNLYFYNKELTSKDRSDLFLGNTIYYLK